MSARLRLTGHVWNRDSVGHAIAIELAGTDIYGNAWAWTFEVGSFAASMYGEPERQPVDVELPDAVNFIQVLRVHPGLPCSGADLRVAVEAAPRAAASAPVGVFVFVSRTPIGPGETREIASENTLDYDVLWSKLELGPDTAAATWEIMHPAEGERVGAGQGVGLLVRNTSSEARTFGAVGLVEKA